MLATQTPGSAAPSRLLGTPTGELKFRVQGGEHDGRILRIAAAKCSIGSAPGCTLRLQGEGFEPLHCLILTGKNGTVVRRNSPKTYLNGGSFEDAALRVGDLLRLGPIELTVAACPQAITPAPVPTPIPRVSAPLISGNAAQASELEQRVAEEVSRARDREQQRLASELEDMTAKERTAQEQLASIRQLCEQVAKESRNAAEQFRDEYARGLERFLVQQREERGESLAREEQMKQELCQAQHSAEALASRFSESEAKSERQAADFRHEIVQLREELRTERNHRQQERADAATIQQELEGSLTVLRDKAEIQRRELDFRQQSCEGASLKIRDLQTQLDEVRQQSQRGVEEHIAEQQREQEEFSAIRSQLELSISTLSKQLEQRAAELVVAHERGGDCAGTLTLALNDARRALSEQQAQRSREDEDRAAVRVQLEGELADLTLRHSNREKELAQCTGELTELRQRVAQLAESDQIVQQLQETLTAAETAHQIERDTWLSERREFQQRSSDWETERNQMESERVTLDLQRRSWEEERHELQSQCNTLDGRCASLQVTVERTDQQLEQNSSAAEAAHQANLEAWQAERSALEHRRSELEALIAEGEIPLLEWQTRHAELQTQFFNLEAQCNSLRSDHGTLQARCSSLETQLSEVQAQEMLTQSATRRGEEFDAQLIDLRSRLEQALATELAQQSAHEQAASRYEEQVERWQSEAHKWQLQAEEMVGKVHDAEQRFAQLETTITEQMTEALADQVAGCKRQNVEALRAQLEMQQQELTEARARLEEEQAVWETSRVEQASVLEQRSQLIAAQIAQFEAEQAAFARQQATIIQQMSSLEDRVQVLTTASESRSINSPFVIPRLDDPTLRGGLERAEQPYVRASSSRPNEPAGTEDDRILETATDSQFTEVTPPDHIPQDVAEEADRLTPEVSWNANDGASEGIEEVSIQEPAQEKARYSPSSFLERAAEMARQEELAGVVDQSMEIVPSSDSPAANQANRSFLPAGSNDDDDSIEQYMNRLLSRVRGGDSVAAIAPAVPRPQLAPTVTSSNSAPVAISESPAEPKEYVPRAHVPEPPGRLSLMRELANTAAKSAIHAHAKQSHKRDIKRKSLVALLSAVGATSLFIAGCFTGSTLAFVGSLAFVVFCGFMSTRALTSSLLQLRHNRPEASEQNQGTDSSSQISDQQ